VREIRLVVQNQLSRVFKMISAATKKVRVEPGLVLRLAGG